LATANCLSKSYARGSYFVAGKEPLMAMNEQLSKLSSAKIDLLKVLLLFENSGPFENMYERKISFDNTKVYMLCFQALLLTSVPGCSNNPNSTSFKPVVRKLMKIAKRSGIITSNIQMFIFVFGPFNTSPMAFMFTIVNIKLK
jgi:hypothetical protein